MAWAKLDDRYDDNRKVKRAWREHPRAVGLHAMAITYSSRHETDGFLDAIWVEERLPNAKERAGCVLALVSAGLFSEVEGGWQVHDYLDYNPSRVELDEQREARSESARKAAKARWGAESNGSASARTKARRRA